MSYNKENIIKPHTVYMLKALSGVVDRIVLVCNYPEIKNDFSSVSDVVSAVFYRENLGWDAGAFKDVLCSRLGWEEVLEFDELVLLNDSFYGPLFPLQETFALFESSDCDYWGMSGQIAGNYKEPYYEFDAHVHSYFMVFKSRVLHSRVFREYWEQLRYPVNFIDALIDYEQKINKVLKEAGFKTDSYTEHFNFPMSRNEIPCYTHLLELIRDHRFPIVKRKALLIRNPGYVNALAAVDYIRQNSSYPIGLLEEVLDSQFGAMHSFCNKYKDLYIYGHGVCGKNLKSYFDYRNQKICGFVVTDREEADSAGDIICVDDFTADQNTGVIISLLNFEIAESIRKRLAVHMDDEQMFLISECDAIKEPK